MKLKNEWAAKPDKKRQSNRSLIHSTKAKSGRSSNRNIKKSIRIFNNISNLDVINLYCKYYNGMKFH